MNHSGWGNNYAFLNDEVLKFRGTQLSVNQDEKSILCTDTTVIQKAICSNLVCI